MGILRAADGTVTKEVKNEYRWVIYNRKRISNIEIIRVPSEVAELHNIDATLIATLDTGVSLEWNYGDFYLARHMAEKFAPSLTILDRRDGEVVADLWANLLQAKESVVSSAEKTGHTLGPWMGESTLMPNTELAVSCITCKRQWRLHAYTPYGQRTRYNVMINGGSRTCSTKSSTSWRYTGDA